MGAEAPPIPGLPKLRNDLIFSRRSENGKTVFVIKDPVSHRFYRFGDVEFFIASQMDGSTTLETVQQRAASRFGATPSLKTLTDFESRLNTLGLLDDAAAGANRGPEKHRPVGGSLLYMRLKAVNPDRFLARLVPKLGFLFTPAFLVLSAASVSYALYLTVHDWDLITRQLGVLLQFKSLLLAWMVVLVVVTLHECAHGLTCKHFGGEVNEIGFLLIYFQPAFYCNVSDAWLFEKRSERLWVTFAGAYFEMFLWALATFVWKLTAAGSTAHYLALVVVATSAVKSLFNLNPLIKLDGYYLLSDYLEIPNLRQRAFGYLRSLFLPSGATGGAGRDALTWREKKIFLLYGGLSAVYSTWLLYIVAAWALNYLVARYRGLGFLAFCAILGLIFRDSIQKTVKTLGSKLPVFWQKSQIRARPGTALLAAALALAALFIPWADFSQEGEFIVLPNLNADVRAQVDGFVESILVQEGQAVHAGQDLAVVSNRDLDAQLKETSAQILTQAARLSLLEHGPRREEIVQAQDAVSTAETRWQFATRDYDDAVQLHAQRLASAQATLKKVQTEHAFAQTNLQRYQELWREGLTSQKDLDSAREKVAVSEAEIQEASAALDMVRADSLAQPLGERAVSENELKEVNAHLSTLRAGSRPEEIAAARAELARLNAQRDFLARQTSLLRVTSPVAGVVATHRTRELTGLHVQKGDVILKIDELSTVTAETSIPEDMAGAIRPGQSVALRTEAYPGKVFEGRVTTVAPQVSTPDPQVPERKLLVDIDLNNPEGELKPGLSGAVKIYYDRGSLFELARRRIARFLRVEFWSWW